MTRPLRLPALLALALAASAACGPAPAVTPSPVTGSASQTPPPTPPASDVPFAPVAWPASGPACGSAGPGHMLGQVAAPDAHTVVFTLCAPDGAFLARLAHPSMGIVDAGDLARIAADPTAARDVAGQGAYRIASWGASNVQLERIGAATPASTAQTVILRWAAGASTRTADVVAASVDGIDAPDPSSLDSASTNPALAIVPRPLLSTAVLGFGLPAFGDPRVRQAIASGIDLGSLAADAFPAGSTAADHVAACDVPSGCAGPAFRAFNGPAAAASLQNLKFNLDATYPLTIPDTALPGLPDPSRVANALHDQLATNLGLKVQVATLPADQFRAAVDGGTLPGLYLDAVTADVADASAFYGPLFLDDPQSMAARMAGSATSDMARAASLGSQSDRTAAYVAAATKIRDSVPVAPLVHAGGVAVYRSDVKGAATSPLGEDPLGAMVAADRGQVVFEQASAPSSGWCGWQASPDANRLCALVTQGLYGEAGASLVPTPQLASGCTPNADATVWTCRLRDARTASGLVLDASDVVATVRAMADPTDPVHQALGDAAFAGWANMFGVSAAMLPAPTPSPSPVATASPAAPAGSASAGASRGPSSAPTAASSSPAASGGASGKP